MKTENIGLGKTINLIKLSDAFRRHAHFDDVETVRELVREASKFGRLSTWYDPHEKFRHADLKEKFGAITTRIAELAEKLGAKSVELPVTDKYTSFARFFNKQVLPGLDLPVTAKLQNNEYRTDLSALGPIDWRYKTAIDKGVRGMAEIKPKLWMNW